MAKVSRGAIRFRLARLQPCCHLDAVPIRRLRALLPGLRFSRYARPLRRRGGATCGSTRRCASSGSRRPRRRTSGCAGSAIWSSFTTRCSASSNRARCGSEASTHLTTPVAWSRRRRARSRRPAAQQRPVLNLYRAGVGPRAQPAARRSAARARDVLPACATADPRGSHRHGARLGHPGVRATLVHEGGIVARLMLAADRLSEWRLSRRAGGVRGRPRALRGFQAWALPPRRVDGVRATRRLARRWVYARRGGSRIRLRKRPRAILTRTSSAHGSMPEGFSPTSCVRSTRSTERSLPRSTRVIGKQVLWFWERLRSAVEGPLDRRERLVALLLDGDDVFGSPSYVPLLERLVRSFSHTIAEVARRSPNKDELSLNVRRTTARARSCTSRSAIWWRASRH